MEISNEVTEEEYNEALKNKELLRKKLFDLRYAQYEHKKDTQKSIEINELIKQTKHQITRELIKIKMFETAYRFQSSHTSVKERNLYTEKIKNIKSRRQKNGRS